MMTMWEYAYHVTPTSIPKNSIQETPAKEATTNTLAPMACRSNKIDVELTPKYRCEDGVCLSVG